MFIVFDLETTGLSTTSCDIIQLAYLRVDDTLTVIDSGNLYFYYEGMSWSEDAYKVHSIPLSFLKQHENKFKENLIKVYALFNGASVIGHNSNTFDLPFLRNWLARQGLRDFDFGVYRDTMVDMRPLFKTPRISLVKLTKLCGFTHETVSQCAKVWFGDSSGAHDARYDVTATALIAFKGLRENVFNFYNQVTVNDDLDLFEDMDDTGIFITCSNGKHYCLSGNSIREVPGTYKCKYEFPNIITFDGKVYTSEFNSYSIILDGASLFIALPNMKVLITPSVCETNGWLRKPIQG